MKRILLVTVTMLILGLSAGAHATFIDFRGDYFNSADKDPYFLYAPAGLKITPGPDGAALYWDQTDGFGVRSSSGYEYDEIEGAEYLHLSFETPQILNEIRITDLFYESCNSISYQEIGYYRLQNNTWSSLITEFKGTKNYNGELTLIIPSILITDIWFSAPGEIYLNDVLTNHEFSVAGIDITPVPEPATMLLLGSGLAGIFGLRRRFKK